MLVHTPYVDYFAINISSPNTKGLRDLHNKNLLEPLIKKITSLNYSKGNPKPILLKISPAVKEVVVKNVVKKVPLLFILVLSVANK